MNPAGFRARALGGGWLDRHTVTVPLSGASAVAYRRVAVSGCHSGTGERAKIQLRQTMILLFLWMRRLWGCGQRSCVVHKSTGGLAPGCSTTSPTPAGNSRSRALRRSAEVGLVGRAGRQARMRALGVVEVQIPAQRGTCIGDAVVGAQVDLLILHRAPQPLDEHVVTPGAATIHADGDAVLQQQAGEVCAGELAALVGVEDLRLAVTAERLLDRLQAELHFQRD